MKRSRTLKTAQATSSTDEKSRTVNINLTAPTSWRALSQEQLLTVFDLMAIEQDPTAVKTYMLIYFCGLHVIRHTRFGWKLYKGSPGNLTSSTKWRTWTVGWMQSVASMRPMPCYSKA